MSGFLDTSVVVRYLTGDPPEMAAQAARIIDSDLDLRMTDAVLIETAYVLTSVYRVSRPAVVDHLLALVQRENISTFALGKDVVLQALRPCRPSGQVSFTDAMVWAAARSAGPGLVYSLDERFPSDGVSIRSGL